MEAQVAPEVTTDATQIEALTSESTNDAPENQVTALTSSASPVNDVSSGSGADDLFGQDPLSLLDANRQRNDLPAVVRPQTDKVKPDEAKQNSLAELPPELARFTKLLDIPGPGIAPVDPAPAEPVEAPVLDRAADDFIDPMLIATPPAAVNVANALKMKLAIKTNGYPLSDLALVVGELSGIPAQIDWVSLDLLQIDPAMLAQDPKPGWKTLADLIDLAVTTVDPDLVVQRRDEGLTITVPVERLTTRLDRVLAVDDLATTEDEKQATLEQVGVMVQQVGLDGVDQVHLRALLTESFRRLRGLDGRLADDTWQRWCAAGPSMWLDEDALRSPAQPLPSHWSVLDGGKSGPQLDAAITLAGLLRRTARLNNATVICNWNDARIRRVSPAQLVLPHAGVSADAMLDATLTPLGLEIRSVGNRYWWVGTPSTYDRLPIVVGLDALGPNRGQVMAKLMSAADGIGSDLVLHHDPVSDGILAVMPRFFYRQLPIVLRPFVQSN
ncbi:MAG: hypothetical protein AAF539_12795 [Planctomycetota bacterium]